MAINPLDPKKGVNLAGQTTAEVKQAAAQRNASKVIQPAQGQAPKPSTVQTSDIKQAGVTPLKGEAGRQTIRRTALGVAESQKRRGGLGIRRPESTVEAATDDEALQLARERGDAAEKAAIAGKTPFEPEVEAVEEPVELSEAEQLIEEGQSIQDKAAQAMIDAEDRLASTGEIQKEQAAIQKQASRDSRDVQVRQREMADVERRKKAAEGDPKKEEAAALFGERTAGVDRIQDQNPELSRVAAGKIYDKQQQEIVDGFFDEDTASSFNDYLSDNPDAEHEEIFQKAAGLSDDLDGAEKLFASQFNKDIAGNMRDDYLINVRGVDPATVKADRNVVQARETEAFLRTGQTNDGGLTASNYVKQLLASDPTGKTAEANLNKLLADPNLNAADRDILSFRLGDVQRQRIANEEKSLGDIQDRYLTGKLTPEEETSYLDRTRKFELAKKAKTVNSGGAGGGIQVYGMGSTPLNKLEIPDKFAPDIEDVINGAVDGSLSDSQFNSAVKLLPKNTQLQVIAAKGRRLSEKVKDGGDFDPASMAQAIFDGSSTLKLGDIPIADRGTVAKELNIMKNKALGSGDINGMMQASAGGRELNATQTAQFEKGMTVIEQLGSLKSDLSSIDTGPILGIFKGKNPYDVSAREVQAKLTATIPILARGVYGEVGVLTDADVELYRKTLPNLEAGPELNNALMAMTLKSVQRGLESKIKINARAGYDMSGFVPIYEDLKAQSDALLRTPAQTAQVESARAAEASFIGALESLPQPTPETITAEEDFDAIFLEGETTQAVSDDDISDIFG